MKKSLEFRLLLLCSLLLFSAVRCRSAAEGGNATTAGEEARAMTWQVSLDSSGGITGRGVGSMMVSSDGSATFTDRGETRALTPSADQIAEIDRHVARAWPTMWSAPPEPRVGADMISYTLEIRRGGETKRVTWREDVEPQITPELRQLVAMLRRLRTA